MSDGKLFLGYPVEAEELNKRSSLMERASFISVEKVVYKGQHYLGKFVGREIETEQLEMSRRHLMSLWKKEFPNRTIHPDAFLLCVL